MTGRTEIWKASLDAAQERPVLGHGYGAVFWTTEESPGSAVSLAIFREVRFTVAHAHSGPLDLALHLGIVGLALFAAAWLGLAARSVRLLFDHSDVGRWIFLVLVGQLVLAVSEPVFGGRWLLVLGLHSVIALRERDAVRPPPLDWRRA